MLGIAACGVDQVPPTGPALTTTQLALGMDSLAGALPPGDPRVNWLQQIDNGLALGAPRTLIEIDVDGKGGFYWAVATASIAPLDSARRAGEIDSTYVLAAWQGVILPSAFLELDINFARRAYGQPDTAESQVVYFKDSTASALVGDTVVGALQNTVASGACTPVKLVNLVLPAGTCTLISTEIGYQSSIDGMPFRYMRGARLMLSR